MVHQTTDSKFSEYGRANAEAGLPKHDKQLMVAGKNTKNALKDLSNENLNTMLTSIGSSPFPKERGSVIEAVKISGTKRPQPEGQASPSQHQSPTNNAATGHLVYVRRKTEAELGKHSSSNNGKIQPQSQVKDSKICVPEVTPIPKASSVSGKPSTPPPIENSNKNIPPSIPSDNPKKMNIQYWEDRYCRLQNLLKILDQSTQEDYVHMLRSLSSVGLSRHAVELEKRSIQLSLEEGEEMQRVRFLDVLATCPKNSRPPSSLNCEVRHFTEFGPAEHPL